MERGTRREFEAVRARWRELERKRRATDRFLLGLALVGSALALLLLAAATRTCLFTPGGAAVQCTKVGSPTTGVAAGALGPLALLAGVRVCLGALSLSGDS
ncbi:MAG: hypothetical protein ABEH35_06875 [Haloarculaceae archaeon]